MDKIFHKIIYNTRAIQNLVKKNILETAPRTLNAGSGDAYFAVYGVFYLLGKALMPLVPLKRTLAGKA